MKTLSADPVRSLMVSMPDDVVDAALLALDDDDFLTRFRAEFGACESHGAFPLNALHEGRVVWFADCCPACNRQAVADRMLRDADIPLILANASFASYLTPTVEQQRVLGAVRAYADAFCADIRYGSSSRLLFGNSGTGKNHLMVSLAKQLMSKGHTVKVVTATDLLERLWSLEFRERSTWLKGLVKLSLLVIDELDKAPQSDAAQNGLFRVIDARNKAARPTFVIGNGGLDNLAAVLGKPALDRLSHFGGKTWRFTWDSFRAKAVVSASAEGVESA